LRFKYLLKYLLWRMLWLVVGLISFITCWYTLQYFYTPTPRSETASILTLYERQGCVTNPDFIPSNLVVWDSDKHKVVYVPFDENFVNYKIVYFCP
jgi:hypothetical protein